MGKSLNRWLMLAAVSLSLLSCTSGNIQSVAFPDSASYREGMSYSLPVQYVRLVVERKEVDADKQKEAAKKLAQAAADVEKEAGEAKQKVETLSAIFDQLNADAKASQLAKDNARAAKETAAADYERLKKKSAEAKQKAKDASEKGAKTTMEDSLSLATESYTPDPCHRYSIAMRHRMSSDDNWKLKTTAAGLLSSSDTTSTSRVGEILVELSRLAGLVAGQMAPMASPNGPRVTSNAPLGPFKYERLIDVTTDVKYKQTGENGVFAEVAPPACAPDKGVVSAKKASEELATLGVNFELLVHPVGETERVLVANGHPKGRDSCDGDHCYDGLAYRRPLPYAIEVVTCANEDTDGKGKFDQPCVLQGNSRRIVTRAVIVAVPNRSPIEVLPYTSAPFVTANTKAEFADGMLVSVEASRPSELLEIARTPGRMIEAAGSALKSVSPIQVDYVNKQRDRAEAEARLYKAQKEALDAQAAYERAKAEADE